MTQLPDSSGPGTGPNPDPGPGPEADPKRDPLYRAILGVLVASVLVGAVLTLAGETLFDNRPLASVGLGMAVIAGIAYWVIRLAARRAARNRHGAGKWDSD